MKATRIRIGAAALAMLASAATWAAEGVHEGHSLRDPQATARTTQNAEARRPGTPAISCPGGEPASAMTLGDLDGGHGSSARTGMSQPRGTGSPHGGERVPDSIEDARAVAGQ